ncbi:hypothetical protein [Mesorhizobium sp.]|uniref:hypothetical protein n=1 Tax=Mesorhizobium sp. TaxID=1871066 RepID=UPI000FE9B9B1|nr:hypothetical protein [Mesorhizobium sp.]RWD79738.1 MAG: hypothetical protein EOS48_21195 [Mesorhizobium sp.]
MPILEINGRRVEVDDSFVRMSSEQQNSTVDEIARSIAPGRPAAETRRNAPAGANPFDQFDPPAAPVAKQPGAPRIISFEGRRIQVPQDATDDEIREILEQPASPKPGLFDDLIPKQSQDGGTKPGLFDDLMPAPPVARSATIADFQNGTGAFSDPAMPNVATPGQGGDDPMRDPLYVIQRADRGIADVLGTPVDLAAAGMNLGLMGADKLAGVFGGGVDTRIKQPFMGSDWIADKAAKTNEAVGGTLVKPEDVSPNVRMVGEAARYGTSAVLGGGSLASAPVQALSNSGGRLASILKGYAAPYKEAPRALIGDAAAGVGAGAAMSGYEDSVPDSVKEHLGPFGPMITAFLGGLAGATGNSVVSGGKDLVETVGRNIVAGKADPAAPTYADAGRRFSRSEMDEAARAVQAQASNPLEAAATIREGVNDARQFATEGQLPTTGALSNDVGLTLLEREARAKNPKPFIERDRATNARAGQIVSEIAPVGSNSRDFTNAANDIQRGREAAAQTGVQAAQATQQRLAEQLKAAAAPVAAGAGQKVPASQNLDTHIVDQSLRPMQTKKNTAFAAVDPDRTVVRDAAPIIGAAKSIRDSLGRLNDPGSVLPTQTLDRIAGLATTAGGTGTITYGELNALRPELAASLVKARSAGDFALADNVQALQRALNQETDRLAREATPAGARAAAAQQIYNSEFAPVWNVGPGDEATRFRRDVNSDRLARTQSPPSATAGRFLQAGQPEKVESLRRVLASVPEPAAAQVEVRRYLVADLAESGAVDSASGQLRPDALRRWRNQWGDSLDVAPGFRSEVDGLLSRADDGAIRMGRLANDTRLAESRLADTVKNRGALGLVLGKDPVHAVSSVFRSGDPSRAMKAIVGEVGTNKRAVDGLKSSVVDYLTQKVTSPSVQRTADATRPVEFNKLENLFNQHEHTLAAVFSPEEMNSLRQAHRLLKPQKELAQPGATPSLYERKKSEEAWNLLEGGLKARYGVLKGGSVLRTIRIFIATLPNKDAAVRDLILRMHFDPELASHLLGREVKVDTPSWNGKLNTLLAAAAGARDSVRADAER